MTVTLNAFERVKREKSELLFKMNNLDIFLNNNKGDTLQLTLLQHQRSIMQMYVDVLTLRINNWEEK